MKKALLLLCVGSLNAMMVPKGKISQPEFKEMAVYTNKFLKDNFYRLACQKNESGFVRINIPIHKEVKPLFKGISKIRLNYWDPETGVAIQPESIHNHPNYFESLIIKGGYDHALYEIDDDQKHTPYDLYRIMKEADNKSFSFIGQAFLKHLKDETFNKGNVVIFDKDLIHRVLKTNPKTLTMNAIFNGSSLDNKSYYNVFLTQNGKLDDVKTSREIISNHKARPFIQAMINNISDFTKID